MDSSESYYREKEKGRERDREREILTKNIPGNGEGWFCSSSFLIILNILNSKRERERQRLELRVERFRGEILTTGKKIITEGWFISINGVLLLF